MAEKTLARQGTPAPGHDDQTLDARILTQLARGDRILAEDLMRVTGADIVTTHLPDLLGKTVLITGATGLIGSLLARTFAAINTRYADHSAVDDPDGKRQHQAARISIYLILRNRRKAETIYGEAFLSRPDIHLIETDLTKDSETWPALPDQIDYMIHAAAVTSSKTMVTQPIETIGTALLGTRNMLALASRTRTRSFVYISSMEVYGDMEVYRASADHSSAMAQQNSFRASEDTLGFLNPQAVRSDYPESKRMCENMCTAYYVEKHVPVKTARLAQTFGAGILPWENRVFAQFARAAMQGEDIVLHTKGRSEGNYCYTADCIRGILTILLQGTDGEAYNVANEACHTTIAAMAQMVAERFGNAPANVKTAAAREGVEEGACGAGTQEPAAREGRHIRVVFDIPKTNTYGYAADTHLFLDSTKLRRLGWEPEVDLPQMYERMIASMRHAASS